MSKNRILCFEIIFSNGWNCEVFKLLRRKLQNTHHSWTNEKLGTKLHERKTIASAFNNSTISRSSFVCSIATWRFYFAFFINSCEDHIIRSTWEEILFCLKEEFLLRLQKNRKFASCCTMKLCLKYVNILRRNGEERVANNQNVCRYSFRYYGAVFPRLTNIYLKKDSWKQIRRYFPEKPSIVYMNTGSVANSGGEVIAIISNGNWKQNKSDIRGTMLLFQTVTKW